jgi:hypothetical protein
MDWTAQVQGIHGAIILAKANPNCEMELKDFLGTRELSTMSKPIRALIRANKLIDKGA